MSFIYLGTPYSHPEPAVRQVRYKAACFYASILAQHKIACYCPIAAWHPIALAYSLPGDHEFWWQQDLAFLQHCSQAWFICRSGELQASKGMQEEIRYLSNAGRPICIMKPEELAEHCEMYMAILKRPAL